MSKLVQSAGPQNGSILRFDPAYWTIDFNLDCAASLITTGDRGLKLSCTFRTDKDLVGLIWASDDLWSHPFYRYASDYDYRGCKLQFDFVLTNLLPLDDANGLVMTVIANDEAETPYYVRLENYRIAGTTTAGRIHLDFDTVKGGFAADTDIPWGNVKRMFIGVIPPAYVRSEVDPVKRVITEVECTLDIYNIHVVGAGTTLPICNTPQAAHSLRMTDGYDDAYNLTPQRVVDGIHRLGYRDWYVIYLGITHMHQVSWSDADGRLIVDPRKPTLNMPTRRWLTDLFQRLTASGFRAVVSVSFEILASVCPSSWQQRAWNGTPAATGWSPPSSLIAPTSDAALAYLGDIYVWCMQTLKTIGAPLHFQVGEPWWWDGTYTDGSPCIYDETTKALYVAETGLAVPAPYIASSFEPVGIHGTYLAWLRDKLGAATLVLRDRVKSAYPSSVSYILIFTPQVLNPVAPILEVLNFPERYWRWPAFDVVQLEDYDWVITAEWSLHSGTLNAGLQRLKQPLERLHYFAGFNLLPETAYLWENIDQAANDGFSWGVAEVSVWARPQVWRDGFLWSQTASADDCGCGCDDYEGGPIRAEASSFSYTPLPDTGGDELPPYVPPTGPSSSVNQASDLAVIGNTFGDALLSFSPNGEDPTAITYVLEVLNPVDGTVVRTITLDGPSAPSGRVEVEYPIEQSADDFGFAPTYLSWRVRANGGSAISSGGNIPINNAAIVKKAVLFCGQSNAVGHFTTLSGATLAQGSAAYFRRLMAAHLGLRNVEVIPVELCWGSSAADRLADDDPVAGVNYWYDLDAETAGPRLTQAIAAASALGVPVAAIIWAQGENDVSATSYADGVHSSSPTRYRTATERIFYLLRQGIGQPTCPIYFQMMGRAFYGPGEPPPEPLGATYKTYRDTQQAIAAADPTVHVGTWTPGAEDWHNYVTEEPGPGRIHYLSPVYHACAEELADAIANSIDRIGSKPAWASLDPPAGIGATREGDYDIRIDWTGGGGEAFAVINISVVDGTQISYTEVTGPSFTFTAAQQNAEYGSLAGYVVVYVMRLSGGVLGPATTYIAEVSL